jgi:hypothetical protein
MAELKTKKNNASVTAFVKAVENDQRRADAKALLKLFREATGLRPKMWGDSIIGYGSYHYKSPRSSQEGDWPLTGFSPRKRNLSIYIMPGFRDKKTKDLLKSLGKYKTSVSCLYINKLSDVDSKVLTKIVSQGFKEMKKRPNGGY